MSSEPLVETQRRSSSGRDELVPDLSTMTGIGIIYEKKNMILSIMRKK